MEARRRRRMAEMLAAQAYQPQDVGVAPIPKAAPLVQGLQAFLTARQQRKAEEAGATAEKAGRKELLDYIRSFEPEEKTVDMGNIAAMEAATPYLDESGRLQHAAPSAVAAPNQRLAPAMTPTGEIDINQPMQMRVGGPLTLAQKRARALEGFESTNPMLQQFALSQYEKTMPKELDLKVAALDPSKVDMASVAEAQRTGDISKIKPRAAAPEAMTPYQQAQLKIEQERLAFQKSRAGQASERPKAPSGHRYTDTGDLEPIPGGPFDPNRVRDLPNSIVTQVTQEKRNAGKFTNALKTTNNFIDMIEKGELPLNKLSAVEYASKRAFDLARNEAGDPTEPYVRYYELERFVNQQVNTILSAAKGPQTDQDALRARQQILDNPNNENVVLSALRDLQRIWNEEIELSSAAVEDLITPYGHGSRNRGARGSW
jgi:hypothetical protein